MLAVDPRPYVLAPQTLGASTLFATKYARAADTVNYEMYVEKEYVRLRLVENS